jgi:hypothetical protein
MMVLGAVWPFLILTASAEPAAVGRVHAEVDTTLPVWVGQAARFHVDLMSPTLFSGTPRFELPTISGATTTKVAGRPILNTETINNQQWSIQRHEFVLYLHRPGRCSVPSFTVEFAVAPAFGEPPQIQRLVTPALAFEARMPPGAEGLSMLVSTTDLQIEELWDPPIPDDGPMALEVGDALTRTITTAAADVPGMALPATVCDELQHVSCYPRQPAVDDRVHRGVLTGERRDRAVFVFERPGRIVIPGRIISWWDIEHETLQRITVPEVVVKVVGSVAGEQGAGSTAEPANATTGRSWLAALIGGFVLLGALGFRLGRLLLYSKERRYFSAIKSGCRDNDAMAVLQATYRWLACATKDGSVRSLGAFANHVEQPELAKLFIDLERHVVGRGSGWCGSPLLRELKLARRRRLRNVVRPGPLPPLNPTDSLAHDQGVVRSIGGLSCWCVDRLRVWVWRPGS